MTPSASCFSAVSHERLRDSTRFLLELLESGRLSLEQGEPLRVAYHDSCQSKRELGLVAEPRRVLELAGYEVVDLPDIANCCGFGGTFSIKNPDVSAAMLADKMESVIESRAEVLCAGDRSCLMHIGGGLERIRAGVRTLHLAEILASTEAEA